MDSDELKSLQAPLKARYREAPEDAVITGAAAGWSGFSQMAMGSAASQLVGSLQTNHPFAVFWFMAVASILALAIHWRAMRT